jgi:hypothetical protein
MLNKNSPSTDEIFSSIGKAFVFACFAYSLFVIVSVARSNAQKEVEPCLRLRQSYEGLSPEEY